MENYTYKGISGSKYVSGEIEALNLDEASHKLKQQKIIITNITKIQKKEVFPEESDGLKLRDPICRKVCAFPQLASASSRNLFCRHLDVFFRGVAAAASYVSETAAPPPPHNLEQILWLLLRGLKYGVIAKTTLSR